MSQNWKTIKVFISSTFRDMQTERNHLVRVVFPELKERCLKRHVHLIDVDLRWGVTEKQAEGTGALDICLDTIDSCRPYFLGLLGQRYGTIPNGQTDSITAQEIYHGVLHDNVPSQVADLRPFIKGSLEERELDKEQIDCLTRCYQWNHEKNKYLLKEGITPEEAKTLRSIFYGYSIYQKDRSFFYFRSETLTKEIAGANVSDYFETDEGAKAKLTELKQEIINAKLPYFEYNDIEKFGQKVLKTLWERISAEFPEKREETKRDWLKEEAEFHELFMADRTRWFVGRTNILKKMHAFAEDDPDSRVMAITGEPGCGKSALMARFTEQATRSHPDWLILPHFVGASPSSTSLRQTLRRLCAELNRALGVTEEVPEEYKELIQLFPQLLEKAAKTDPILLIIDALNQFERADNAHSLRWLPQQPPLNVKVVVSTLAGEALDALKAWRFQPQFEELGGLTEPETELFVANYLKEVRKEFPTPEIRDAFNEKIKSGHPLYILVALEELRVFPLYEEMRKRVDSLPETVSEMFDQVLKRIESDFGGSLVQDFMSFIACGRHGMTSEELQELLGKHTADFSPEGTTPKLPDMLFSRLRRAFSAYLFERSGVIDFFHGQLKEAVGTRYLQAESDRLKVHHIIASYFEGRWREPYLRAVDELPHQLTKAKEWDGAERVLCDLHFVETKCAAGLTYDLVHDYDTALDALPESRQEIEERKGHEARLEKYVDDLIRYAKGKIVHLEVIPSFAHKDELIERDTERVLSNPTRLDKIRAFSQFVNSQSHVLTEFATYPGFTVQQAYNFACNGPVASAAELIANAEADHVLLLSHALQRPEYLPHPALLKTMRGDKSGISCVSLTPDGKRAISGSSDRTLRVWDVETGQCLKKLQEYETRRMWNEYTGECKIIQPTTLHEIYYVNLTPDGKTAISTSADGNFRVWDLETGQCLKKIAMQFSLPYSSQAHAGLMSLTPDGKTAIFRNTESTLKVFDLESGECTKTLKGTGKRPYVGLKLMPDGKTAISGDDHGTLMVWNIKSGECIKKLQLQTQGVLWWDFTLDGKRAISGYWNSTLRVWDLETGECTKTLHHPNAIKCGSLTPDGKKAISGSQDHTLKVWDLESGECLKTLLGHEGGVDCVSLTPDGRRALSGSFDRTLRVWDVETGKCTRTLRKKHSSIVEWVGLTPDGKRAVSGSRDHTLKVWDMESGNCTNTLLGHKNSVTSVAFTSDGKRAVSGSDTIGQGFDSILREWDVETGECVKKMQGHNNAINYVSLTLDGKRAISASHDCTLRVWDLETGECTRTLEGGIATCVTPDGKRAISASRDNLRLWDLESGECIKNLQRHEGAMDCLSLTLDGKRAISASPLRVWDLETGQCLKKLQGHTDVVSCVSLTPDGMRAVSGSWDHTLRVWDLETGRCLAIYEAEAAISSLSGLAPDGHFVVGTNFGKVIFFVARNLIVEKPLVTPVRLFLYGGSPDLSEKISSSWDANITVVCQWCGKRFPVPEEKLNKINSINRNANFSPDHSSCLELPSEAWKDPRLLLECPVCSNQLRLNPFIIDNSRKQENTRYETDLNQRVHGYDKSPQVNKQDAEAWNSKGVNLDSSGCYDEALECYDRALETNPKCALAWYNKGGCLISLKRYNQAVECCNKALEINPRYAFAWFNKGVAEEQLGLKKAATTSYRRLIEIAQTQHEKYVRIARKRLRELEASILSMKDNGVRTKRLWETPVQEEVETGKPPILDADELLKNGEYCLEQGRCEQALKYFTNALKVKPDDLNLLAYRATALTRLSRNKEAIALIDYILDKHLATGLNLAYMYAGKANALVNLKRFEESLDYYQKALKIAGNVSTIWYMQGFAYYSMSKYELALKNFQKANALSTDEKTREFIGWCNYGMKKYDEALKIFEQLTINPPRDSLSWYGLGLAAKALGKIEQARDCIQRFLNQVKPEHADLVPQANKALEDLEK